MHIDQPLLDPTCAVSSKRLFFGVVAIVSVAALVACTGTTKVTATSQPPTPAVSVDLPSSQIPWNRVGPGWVLATGSATPGEKPGQSPPAGQPATPAPVTLYLLDPAGGRYAIATFPPSPPTGPGDSGHTPKLADWSGDGRHALFEDDFAGGNEIMTEVDLASGAKQTAPAGPCCSIGVAYARPAGQAILVFNSNVDGNLTSTLERVDLSGNKQRTLYSSPWKTGRYNDAYLQTPDGSQLVLGTHNGMVVATNDGVVTRELPMAGPRSDCRPVRWWTPTTILASCHAPPSTSPMAADYGTELWQVPLAGGAPTALTRATGQDLGYQDAWQLPSGTFLQNVPGCGGDGLLFRLTQDEQAVRVTVPGVDDRKAVVAIGATADKLVLETSTGCGARAKSLVIFDPAANTSTVLPSAPADGNVQRAILYPAS